MKRQRRFAIAGAAVLALLASGVAAAAEKAAAAKLKIDPQHSHAGFKVRHMFTHVTGEFRRFEAVIEFDEANPANSSVTATIDAASIDTGVEARDKDLRSDRFFDVESFPSLTFASRKVTPVSGSKTKFKIRGDLTMHGVTREVVLDAEFLGKGKDPWGNQRYGFHAETRINRKDFGMAWNEILEAGGFLVGEEVHILLDIEALPS
jgi:polyisoprenoid-binding protein YceI